MALTSDRQHSLTAETVLQEKVEAGALLGSSRPARPARPAPRTAECPAVQLLCSPGQRRTSPAMLHSSLISLLFLAATILAQQPRQVFATRPLRAEARVEVVEAEQPSLFARLVGEETQARVIESINTWANDKAKENPGCVERFVCETYKTGETMSGIPYLLMSLTK